MEIVFENIHTTLIDDDHLLDRVEIEEVGESSMWE